MAAQQNTETLFRAVEESLHTVFKEQRYEVPYYQRPYAWEKDNAEELFTDLVAAFQSNRKGDVSYFLGSVVLFDGGKSDRHKIIDGQQRLVTLQLLLLALANQIKDATNKEELLSYVRSKENVFAGTKSEPVVKIGERYQKFFEKLVYSPDAVVDDGKLSKPEQLLLGNYRYFQQAVQDSTDLDPIKFAVFVMQRCLVASLRARQEQSALRIFTVLNDRGVDLHPVDILKAQLISGAGVSDSEMERYAREWEENEYALGRTEFLNLFNYIRMIFVKSRSKRLLHEEIIEEINSKPKIRNFLDEELPLYCDLYAEILNPTDHEVRNIVKVLEATGQKDWVAPMLFMLKHKDKLDTRFTPILKKLAAVSLMMLCTPFTEGQRVGRYGRIIVELESLIAGSSPDKLTNLSATDDELAKIEQNLQADAYSLRNIRAFLLWSETLVGDGGRSIESGKMTVEHLLPNKVGDEKYWQDRFPGDQWAKHANQIGNLVLVSSRMNSKMSRRSFPDKKKIIKKRVKGGWIITDQALENNDWIPGLVMGRSEDLLKRAKSAMRAKIV